MLTRSEPANSKAALHTNYSMSYNVLTIPPFNKQFKRLVK